MNHMGLKADSIEMDKWEIERAHRDGRVHHGYGSPRPHCILIKVL